MRTPWLLAALILGSCVRNPTPPPVLALGGEAPVFPRFTGQAVKMADPPGTPYELDGVVLRALVIASSDFLPSGPEGQPCWNRPESYRYRVIREENIIYIRIHADPAACKGKFLMLDSGVSYAISADGRILRRVFTGEPDWESDAGGTDGGASPTPPGEQTDAGEPDLAPVLQATWGEPRTFLSPDGGMPEHDGGSPARPR